MAEENITGLPKNTRAALTYVLWWVSGLIFLLIDKDPDVRFHATQSIVVFGLITLALFVPIIGWVLSPLFMVIGLILWIFLIIKSFQGEKVKVPYLGDFAEKQLGKIK